MLKRWITCGLLACLLTASVVAQPAETFTFDGVEYRVEKLINANYPVALAFAPDGRLFYTEKNTGSVRVISADGVLQPEPVITFGVDGLAERGLLGIAVDPAFDENGTLWVYYTAAGTARDYPENRVVRFTVADNLGSDPQTLLSVPITGGTLIHNGGNLHFDREGRLLVTIGDYENAANSQDLDTLPGAIHRFAVTEDGLVPADGNPFEGSSVYAYGVRNSFDFAFDLEGGRIFATENGQHCDDEINLIAPGFNYGAGPNYVCGDAAPGIDRTFYLPPLLRFTPTQAPTGILVYGHEAAPEWIGSLFFCVWNDGNPSLRRIRLDERRTSIEDIAEVPLGASARCRIDIEIRPADGALVFTTVGADGGTIWALIPTPSEQN